MLMRRRKRAPFYAGAPIFAAETPYAMPRAATRDVDAAFYRFEAQSVDAALMRSRVRTDAATPPPAPALKQVSLFLSLTDVY
jgi:hypothetical protein